MVIVEIDRIPRKEIQSPDFHHIKIPPSDFISRSQCLGHCLEFIEVEIEECHRSCENYRQKQKIREEINPIFAR